ncbi:uncharacterized protein LACBIDRAFT_299840 [Laccaria bicolor S238N-H82]|uniref:Predicted protein n=1 Tax=Laccaria bicolor (strain S238N-H82 / ATCC MYA-4686) TaxID=486041 RepID=B0DFJ7_LACBS|nr:uncharacterized protein LACBIDRAFT_299840 [Laccaria bicolor S238N-H82]EDR06717.1 predicted protein [Laccaria bicolor S238N-H82]|eukprot:XP_001882564.1 predicted protein [Laccaria bicolor S238N-H82]
MPTTTIASLPYDVWAKIVSFIPKHVLRNLYAVNQVLFNFAMEERYKSAYIHHLKDPLTIDCINRLSDPFRASKTRDLHLRPGPLGFLISEVSQKNLQSLKGKIKRTADDIFVKTFLKADTKSEEQREAIRSLLQIVTGLNGVQTLRVELSSPDRLKSFRMATPLIDFAWQACSPALRRVHFDFPLDVMKCVLTSNFHLPNLEELSVRFSITYRTTDSGQVIITNLVPFVNNHHLTLQKLTLFTHEHFHLAPFFHQLSRMPRLASLSVTQGYVSTLQTDTSGLHSFLTLHADTLTSLKLVFQALGKPYVKDPLMEGWFKQPCLEVALPHLRTLEFGLWDFPSSISTLLDTYLKQYSDSLTSLIINNKPPPTYEDLNNIVTGFGASGVLRYLDIGVSTVPSKIFDLLSINLPSLHALSLATDGFLTTKDVSYQSTDMVMTQRFSQEGFCAEMRPLSYPTWDLRHLTVTFNIWSADPNKLCVSAILKALPGLQTFNGIPKQNYLDQLSREMGVYKYRIE